MMTNRELTELNAKRNIYQICVVVRDVRKTVEKFVEILKIGPWKILTFNERSVEEFRIDGKPFTEPFEYIVALAKIGEIEFEVIQPVSGNTIYAKYLQEHGEGLHHVKERIDDAQIKAVAEGYEAKGIAIAQSGLFQTDWHYYLSTESDVGFLYELGNCPEIIVPPEMVQMYPKE